MEKRKSISTDYEIMKGKVIQDVAFLQQEEQKS
jgi:hypothetical protein